MSIYLFSCFCNYAQFGDFHDIHLSYGLVTRSVAAADLDLDGDMDAIYITTPMHGGKIYWIENLGGGNFGAEKTILNGVGELAVANPIDFDNDGDQDILTSIPILGFIGWLENDGIGNFSEIEPLITFTTNTEIHHIAEDHDSDGDYDLIVGYSQDDKISLFENLGNEIFGSEQLISTAVDYPSDLCTSDLDGDGDPDLVSASSNDNKIAWYENVSGIFGTQQILSLIAGQAKTIDAADVDGDGDLDIVSGSASDAKIALYENLGFATFSPQIVLAILTSTPISSIYLSDITGDNAPDIIIHSGHNTGAGNCKWLINSGTGTYGSVFAAPALFSQVRSVYPADMDSDGDRDILLSNSTDGLVHYLINSGTSDFNTYSTISKLVQTPRMIAVADLDSDGLKDLAGVSTTFGGSVFWYKNLGGDNFGDQLVISIGNLNDPMSIEIADFDNDIDQDILVTCLTSNSIVWYKNDGAGNFSAQIVITTLINGPRQTEILDIENDGDFDIIICSNSDDQLLCIENLGLGNFSTPIIINSLLDGLNGLSSADLDNDGFIDLLTISVIDDKIAWYKNLDGTGFSGQMLVTSVFLNPMAIITGDIDNDGDQDIVSGDEASIVIFRNDGTANFSSPELVTNLVENDLKIELGDVDLDGDLDLFSGSSGTYDLAKYENDGIGNFGPQEIIGYWSNNIAGKMIVTDLGDDNDIDLIYCSDIGNKRISWYENYTYHSTQITGRVFIDINQNFVHDSLDIGTNQVGVFSIPQSDFAFTSPSGNYFMNFSDVDGYYVIKPDSIPFWSVVTDSTSYLIEVDTNFIAVDSLDFGIYPDTLINSLSLNLVGGFPRCNETVNYWASWSNVGTTTPSGIVEVILDGQIGFVSSLITPDSIVGQHVFWNFDSLFYFMSELINFQVHMPPFSAMGDTLTSILKISIFDSIGNVSNVFTDTINQILVCAYDPNDKIVEPTGISEEGFISPDTDFLEYTIRFQNTGNDTALNIIITDILDIDLNWQTFTILASSHYVEISGEQNGELTFTFPSIMLPDSNSNEQASHGFVKYRIDLLPDLPIGTKIENTAKIFFDLNPVIETNSTINTIFDCPSLLLNTIYPSQVCSNEGVFGLIPDYSTGSEYEWIIAPVDTIYGNELLWFSDSPGSFDLTVNIMNEFCSVDTNIQFIINAAYLQSPDTVYLCSGESSLIFGQPQTVEGLYNDTLQTTFGCDSVLSTFLKIMPVFANPTDTVSICSGESELIFGQLQFIEGMYYDTLQSIFGCDSLLTKYLYLNPLPIVEIAQISEDTLCIYASDVLLSALPTGGVWSGAASGIFSPSSANLGSNSVYYSYTDQSGCIEKDSILIFVDNCLGSSEQESVQIIINPNPFSNYFVITSNKKLEGEHRITMYNMIGEVVHAESICLDKHTLVNPQSLCTGIYTITITNIFTNEIVYCGKIVAN